MITEQDVGEAMEAVLCRLESIAVDPRVDEDGREARVGNWSDFALTFAGTDLPGRMLAFTIKDAGTGLGANAMCFWLGWEIAQRARS